MSQQEFTRVVYNPFKQVREINISTSATISPGQGTQVSLYAPAGYITRVISMQLTYYSLPGGTSGRRSILVRYTMTNNALFAERDWDQDILFDFGQWLPPGAPGTSGDPAAKGTEINYPEDKAAQLLQLKNLIADENSAIVFEFNNDTNATDMGNSKGIRLLVMDEKIG